MNRSTHKAGSIEIFERDYVITARANKNQDASTFKLLQFIEIALKYDPVNYGDMKTGSAVCVGQDKVLQGIRDDSIINVVFVDVDTVARFLNELREKKIELIIIASGLLGNIDECCKNSKSQRSTIEYSLGIWGKTELLPNREILEISTMCRHSMVSFNLIKHLVSQVEQGNLSAKMAAREMANNCQCGVLNPKRAAKLIEAMVGNSKNNHLVELMAY